MNKIAGIITAAWIMAASTQAGIVTNYYDNFSGVATAPLNLTAPDIRPGSETWAANAAYKADGSFVAGSLNAASYLAFTPEAGKVYTLSADVSNLANAANGARWAGGCS